MNNQYILAFNREHSLEKEQKMQDTLAKKVFAVGSAVAMTLSLAVPFVASAAVHSAGTNVLASDGTIWMVTSNNTRRAYTSAGAFLSYGFNSFATVVPASAEDLALPVDSAGFIPPQDGKIICSDRGADKGTCYLITGGMKAGFTSASVFTGLGFSFSRAQKGDVSFMSSTSNINNTTMAHLPGVLVNNNGTVQLMGGSGLLGIPDLNTFNSWGYSFADVVPANSADKAMTQTGVMAARVAGQLSPSWTTTPGQPPVPPVGGSLSVSLSSMTPAASNYAVGAAFLPFTSVNFTAGSNPVVVTTVKATRSGLGADSNLNNMYLYSGSTMLAQSASFQNGVVTFTNSAGLFTVPANTTMTVTIKGDLASGSGSGLTYAFGINSASDIVSNASGVSGTFPVTGNTVTSASVSSPSLATLTVAAVAVGTSVNAGTQNVLAGQWNLTSANSTVAVKGVTLTMIGSAAATGFANLKLYANGTQVGSTLTSMPANKVIFFDLTGSPINVTTGQTVSLQLKADVVSEVNRTYQFSIQHNYDLVSYDSTYNVGILSGSTFPINSPTSAATINAGSLTITRDSASRTAAVVASQTAIPLATFDFTAYGEDVKILSLPIKIVVDAGGASINNIKLVDDQGYGLGTQVTSIQNVTSGGYTTTFGASSNLNYVVPANTTRKISIVADLTSVNGSASITASLTQGTANAQGVTSVNSIGTTASSGNAITIASNALAGVINSTLPSPVKVVPGVVHAKLASFSLSAGGADSINVSTLTVDAAAASVTNNFQNMQVFQGSTQIGNTQPTISNSGSYTFSPSSPIVIPAGGSVVIDVYADLISSASASLFANQTLFTLDSGSTAQLATSGASVSLSGNVPGQTISTVGNGSVTVSKSPSTPVSRQVAMGSPGVVLGVIKFAETTGNEAATLTDLTLTATAVAGTTLNGSASGSISSFLNFTIDDGSGHTFTKSTWTTGTDGTSTRTYTVTFNNINIPVPMGPNAYLNLSVKADANSFTNGAASNSQWTVGLASASAATIRGVASNASITPSLTTNANSNTTTLARTTVTFGSVASITSPITVTNQTAGAPSSAENVGIFSITANSAADAIVTSITLQQGGQAPTAVAVAYSVYDASNGLSSAVGTGNLTGTGAGAITLNQNSAATDGGVRVPAGQTKYLVIQANTSNFNTGSGGTYKNYTLTLTTWSFSDGTTIFGPSSDAAAVPSPVTKQY
ncbi:MAG: hypothetical protein KGJ93_00985 [Patescibacteria group bacterium]|nr:hypothetical protein [Patescibacteria group bacterium]